MTAETLAAALLRDVLRYDASAVMWTLEDVEPKPTADGGWVCYSSVLAALSRALDPAIAERALALTKVGYGYDLTDDDKAAITALLAQNAWLKANVEAGDLVNGLEKSRAEAAEAERKRLEKHIEDTAKDTHKLLVAAEAKVEKLRGKIRDWEARIDACEWSTNSSLTEDIRAEMRATLTTEADNG